MQDLERKITDPQVRGEKFAEDQDNPRLEALDEPVSVLTEIKELIIEHAWHHFRVYPTQIYNADSEEHKKVLSEIRKAIKAIGSAHNLDSKTVTLQSIAALLADKVQSLFASYEDVVSATLLETSRMTGIDLYPTCVLTINQTKRGEQVYRFTFNNARGASGTSFSDSVVVCLAPDKSISIKIELATSIHQIENLLPAIGLPTIAQIRDEECLEETITLAADSDRANALLAELEEVTAEIVAAQGERRSVFTTWSEPKFELNSAPVVEVIKPEFLAMTPYTTKELEKLIIRAVNRIEREQYKQILLEYEQMEITFCQIIESIPDTAVRYALISTIASLGVIYLGSQLYRHELLNFVNSGVGLTTIGLIWILCGAAVHAHNSDSHSS